MLQEKREDPTRERGNVKKRPVVSCDIRHFMHGKRAQCLFKQILDKRADKRYFGGVSIRIAS